MDNEFIIITCILFILHNLFQPLYQLQYFSTISGL